MKKLFILIPLALVLSGCTVIEEKEWSAVKVYDIPCGSSSLCIELGFWEDEFGNRSIGKELVCKNKECYWKPIFK